MMTGKLGRLPKKQDRRNIQFRDIFNLSTMPSRPAGRDWSMRDGVDLGYPMLGNNTKGDCAYASIAHEAITQSGQRGEPIVVTEEQVVGRYLGDTGSDDGAVMLDVVKSIVRSPMGAVAFDAFVEVDSKDDDAYLAAQEFFGGVWSGWDLPLAWQGADEWTAGPSLSGQWAPRSWGGHAMTNPCYSPGGGTLVTWTQRVAVSHEARRRYCVEAYALFSRSLWLGVQEHCPAGLDLQKLRDLLTAVRK